MRFILVDDDPHIGTVVRRIAESCGFEVETTTRANEFKAACESRCPDVIALDLAVPDCDGIELLRYLGESNCQAQILIISGMGHKMLEIAEHLGRARGLKMSGLISKPMHLTDLRTVLERVRDAALIR
jgi:DNA-binding response OmpR family regulator